MGNCSAKSQKGGSKCSRSRTLKRGGRKRSRTLRRMRGGGCGCSGQNSSSSFQYGGYQYSRKASLDANRRLSKRLSNHRTRKRHRRRNKRRRRRR